MMQPFGQAGLVFIPRVLVRPNCTGGTIAAGAKPLGLCHLFCLYVQVFWVSKPDLLGSSMVMIQCSLDLDPGTFTCEKRWSIMYQ